MGSSTMTEVRVYAAFTVEDEESFLREARKMVDATQSEKGCLHYQLYLEAGKAASFAMIETWETQEDLTLHGQSAHVKAFMEAQKGNVKTVIQLFKPI